MPSMHSTVRSVTTASAVQRFREAAGLSRAELAARAEVSLSAVYTWEVDGRVPARATCIVLALALKNCKPSDLRGER